MAYDDSDGWYDHVRLH